MIRHLTLVLSVAGLALAGFLLPSAAQANVPIHALSTVPSSTQAGGHADIAFTAEIGTPATEGPELPCYCNALRDLTVDTPSGLIATPSSLPQCTAADFARAACPIDTQVGVDVIRLFAPLDQNGIYYFAPLYNMEPQEGQLALLATVAALSQTPIYTEILSRTEDDYGLELHTFGVPSLIPPNEITQITWGVPADPIHDPLRFPFVSLKTPACGNIAGENPLPDILANRYPQGPSCSFGSHGPVPANSPMTPFMQNPTTCSGPLTMSAETHAYDLGTDHVVAPYPATTGCDQVGFNPSLSAQPTTGDADSPSGLDVSLTVPQALSPTTPTPSAIRETSVTLPPGFTINPSAADGKSSCSAAAARFGTRETGRCPETSKIGTMQVTSSSFPSVLPGAIYLGEPLPGERYRVFLLFDGFSLHVKLKGTATPDPVSGQLTVAFRDLPHFNFQSFDLHVFGAERGLLVTPTKCGTYSVNSTFTPWAAPNIPEQTSTQLFRIDSGPNDSPCPKGPRDFAPKLAAGTSDNSAGFHAPFSLAISREDGEQNLTGLSVRTPPGFSATLRGIPYCPEAAIAQLSVLGYSGLPEQSSPSCPPASRIGTVEAAAGAGSHQVHVAGRAYLAGPYKGAPLSLVAVVPAVSGPYDLGNVAVRAALHVDETTARVTAVSDSLPQILDGVPLRIRSIHVDLDREGFTLNPTNCDPFEVGATIVGDEGGASSPSAHFQVANCVDLGFAPKLALRFTGGTKRTAHPAIGATLTYPTSGAYANIRTARVTLPDSELLDNARINAPCTRGQFAAQACPSASRLGVARVETPLLDQPLEGPVYLRTSSNKLPDLVVDLHGQIHFVLVGRIDTVRERLRTSFESVPDVPVSSFRLSLLGGRKGLLFNREELCAEPRLARVSFVGQNGKQVNRNTTIDIPCGKRARSKRHRGADSGSDRARKRG